MADRIDLHWIALAFAAGFLAGAIMGAPHLPVLT